MSLQCVLLAEAARVRENALVPFSEFKVGAALRAGSGSVNSGCYVGIVADPQGTCAKAGAIVAMVTAGIFRNWRGSVWAV